MWRARVWCGVCVFVECDVCVCQVSYSNKFVATTQRKAALRTGTLAGMPQVTPISLHATRHTSLAFRLQNLRWS